MSKDWVDDIDTMQKKFGIQQAVDRMDDDQLKEYLRFRVAFLREELEELAAAEDAEDVVDACVDLCVVAIGTLLGFRINPYVAWDAVHTANMKKVAGSNPRRPNPLSLPDLTKPDGWVAPSHEHNHGFLSGMPLREEAPVNVNVNVNVMVKPAKVPSSSTSGIAV